MTTAFIFFLLRLLLWPFLSAFHFPQFRVDAVVAHCALTRRFVSTFLCKYSVYTRLRERKGERSEGRMNYCAIQRNGVSSYLDRKETVVCPKPRRPAPLNTSFNDHSKILRWHRGHQAELCDARAGSELLDMILSKGGECDGGERLSPQVPLSPPFFCGSPPCRVSNPLVQDARFREEKLLIPSISPQMLKSPGPRASPSSSASRKGGCLRANFGSNPSVRVEGFDCLDRDRRNCSIPALA